MNESTEIYRHYLAALAYRFHRAVENVPPPFAALDIGAGVRPPIEIVRHMTHVLRFALETCGAGAAETPDALDWDGEVVRFYAGLADLDARLERGDQPDEATMRRVLQGPLADAMTHVGQLAMMRRLAGAPVRGERFRKADIRIGRVGPDQAEPTPLPSS